MKDSLFPELTPVKPDEVEEILANAEFRADPFNGKRLTKDILQDEGIIPTYKLVLGQTTVWLSHLYRVLGKRPAVIGFIQTSDVPTVIRSFYRSNSQGVWRYLNDYHLNNGFFDWYAQGHASDTITASLALQKALGAIEKNPTSYLLVERSELVLAGTARERKNKTPHVGSAGKPVQLKGSFYHPDGLMDPEHAQFTDQNQSPDFSSRVASWTKHSPIYGDISVEVFMSHDKSLYFMFCNDNEERAWIAHIEQVDSTFTSTGVMSPLIDAGALTTPAFEYTTLAGEYGNSQKRNGPYVDMFEKYLSKIPIIKAYLAH